jgi:hypothetical protein
MGECRRPGSGGRIGRGHFARQRSGAARLHQTGLIRWEYHRTGRIGPEVLLGCRTTPGDTARSLGACCRPFLTNCGAPRWRAATCLIYFSRQRSRRSSFCTHFRSAIATMTHHWIMNCLRSSALMRMRSRYSSSPRLRRGPGRLDRRQRSRTRLVPCRSHRRVQ